jgi:hypothetical protein
MVGNNRHWIPVYSLLFPAIAVKKHSCEIIDFENWLSQQGFKQKCEGTVSKRTLF